MGPGELGEPSWVSTDGSLPADLPTAREYWLVFRYVRQGLPSAEIAPKIADGFAGLVQSAQLRQLKIAGVQLDIDCPSAKLRDYGRLIQSLRKSLPSEYHISITALLDWFRDGIEVGEVIREADEFVPQFYDGAGRYGEEKPIGMKIDGPRWGAIFNQFGKRFRVGISTFGRVHDQGDSFLTDLSLLDIASNPAFMVRETRTEANEMKLQYRAARDTQIGYRHYEAGSTFEFVLATPESVSAAVSAVRRMGGNCAGVLFFRWPTAYESLTMFPSEALRAAGLGNPEAESGHLLESDGYCATVSCRDLYLEGAPPLTPAPFHGIVDVSAEIEYILPNAELQTHMAGPSRIDFTVPPYCGRGVLFIGRAVTLKPVRFTLEKGHP